MDFYLWLEELALSTWVREAPTVWGYPTVLTLHTFGMSVLVGTSAVLSLRILGVGGTIPLAPLARDFSDGMGRLVGQSRHRRAAVWRGGDRSRHAGDVSCQTPGRCCGDRDCRADQASRVRPERRPGRCEPNYTASGAPVAIGLGGGDYRGSITGLRNVRKRSCSS